MFSQIGKNDHERGKKRRNHFILPTESKVKRLSHSILPDTNIMRTHGRYLLPVFLLLSVMKAVI